MILVTTLAFFLHVFMTQRSIKDVVSERAKQIQQIAITIAGVLTVVGVVVHYGTLSCLGVLDGTVMQLL